LRSPYCLYDNTDVEETHEVYVTKHALSLGRSVLLFLFICVGLKAVLAILRHMFETSVSVQDRHLAMFFVDLMKDYVDLLPPSISKGKPIQNAGPPEADCPDRHEYEQN
jgi:hypothetical protein